MVRVDAQVPRLKRLDRRDCRSMSCGSDGFQLRFLVLWAGLPCVRPHPDGRCSGMPERRFPRRQGHAMSRVHTRHHRRALHRLGVTQRERSKISLFDRCRYQAIECRLVDITVELARLFGFFCHFNTPQGSRELLGSGQAAGTSEDSQKPPASVPIFVGCRSCFPLPFELYHRPGQLFLCHPAYSAHHRSRLPESPAASPAAPGLWSSIPALESTMAVSILTSATWQ